MSEELYEKFSARFIISPETEMKEVPLPDKVQAGYALPNPDGSRKNCGNCYKFVPSVGNCFEVEGNIKKSGMCSYHVYGSPFSAKAPPSLQVTKMDQKLAGYIDSAGDGTSCDTCKNSRDGVCIAVQENSAPAKIEAKACCNRWSKRVK
jgi:hypothetical protein